MAITLKLSLAQCKWKLSHLNTLCNFPSGFGEFIAAFGIRGSLFGVRCSQSAEIQLNLIKFARTANKRWTCWFFGYVGCVLANINILHASCGRRWTFTLKRPRKKWAVHLVFPFFVYWLVAIVKMSFERSYFRIQCEQKEESVEMDRGSVILVIQSIFTCCVVVYDGIGIGFGFGFGFGHLVVQVKNILHTLTSSAPSRMRFQSQFKSKSKLNDELRNSYLLWNGICAWICRLNQMN